MEDPFSLHQWHLSSIDESSFLPIAAASGETLQHNSLNYPNFNPRTWVEERTTKHVKNNSWNTSKTAQASETQFVSCPNLLSFVDSNHMNHPKDVEMVCPKINCTIPSDMISQGILENQNYVKTMSSRPKLSQPQDHIIAERKRREKLSQRFIALSALVPGLQKV